jgi:SAM-dependent methyltransferase
MIDPTDRYRSGAYAEANPDWHEADALHKARAVASLLRWAGASPRTVVDVGCGTGGVLRHLRAELRGEWPRTTWEGFDIAPEAVRRARRTEGEDLSFVEGDFLASERRVDLVTCLDVVEHVADDEAFLRALRDRADQFVFRLPLDLSVLDVLRPRRLLGFRRDLGHRHFWTRAMAEDLLRTTGYRIVHARYDRVPPPTDGPRRRVVDAVRRAALRAVPRPAVAVLGGFSWLVLAEPG